MYVQSFIFTVTSTVTMILFFYNTFLKTNINHYKIKSDNQRKFLNIHNVNKFRNILFDYCNSLDLSELKYEIEKNDFNYINKLLQIKNQIDIYYHNNNIKYYNKLDNNDSDTESSNGSDESYILNKQKITSYTDNSDNDFDSDSTDITEVNDNNLDNTNLDNKEIENIENINTDRDDIDNTEFENIKKELAKLLNN
jgi:hypothetical protein